MIFIFGITSRIIFRDIFPKAKRSYANMLALGYLKIQLMAMFWALKNQGNEMATNQKNSCSLQLS